MEDIIESIKERGFWVYVPDLWSDDYDKEIERLTESNQIDCLANFSNEMNAHYTFILKKETNKELG